MYCHDCNTANTVDSKYCKECGARINDGYRTMMLSVQDMPIDPSEETLGRLTRLLDMAFWHNEAGNIEAAITASEAALAISPNSTTAHSLLGTLYEKKGDDAQAIQHFEAVLALNPDSVADAAKLDQIRRGVHVKAAAPPIAHQLVPPVLLKLGLVFQQKWSALAQTGISRVPFPQQRLYAAGAATAGVLLLGLLLVHPWANAEAVQSYPITPASAPPPAISIDRSAYSSGAASETPTYALIPPKVMSPVPSSGGLPFTAPVLTAHDPFAGRVPTATLASGASPRWSLPAVPRAPASHRRHSGARDLPELHLAALPAIGSGDGLAPAPVVLPNGVGAPLASVASIPQHTVVVSSVVGAAPQDSSQPDLPSHIHITVHQVSDSESNAAPASSGGGSSDEGSRADSFQQRALSLQQQGDYKQARSAYQSAIRAYEAQIASGHDVETAQRGLAACQTGLQICQQSQ